MLFPYAMHVHTLETVESAKYFGLHLHRNWNTHINKVVNKANSTSAFIQRNLHRSPEHIKKLAYKSLVRPTLEYAANVGTPAPKPTYEGLKW